MKNFRSLIMPSPNILLPPYAERNLVDVFNVHGTRNSSREALFNET
jgi:hypothetical protein